MIKPRLWSKFLFFCNNQLETGDYDSHIPFLQGLVSHYRFGREQALWLGLLYMAYYSEGSMWAAFRSPGVKQYKRLPPLTLPITTQRRNLYGGRIQRHLEDLLQRAPLEPWLFQCADWKELTVTLGTVYGNGRWAKYTTSELLITLGKLPITPNTFEIVDSSGPRKGLVAMGLQPTEDDAHSVLELLNREGLEVSPSQLESLLCDWAGMHKGTFYAGRNIDRQQGRIVQIEEHIGKTFPILWEIRKQVFPSYALGELHGWVGMDNPRKKIFRDTRSVLLPGENR